MCFILSISSQANGLSKKHHYVIVVIVKMVTNSSLIIIIRIMVFHLVPFARVRICRDCGICWRLDQISIVQIMSVMELFDIIGSSNLSK